MAKDIVVAFVEHERQRTFFYLPPQEIVNACTVLYIRCSFVLSSRKYSEEHTSKRLRINWLFEYIPDSKKEAGDQDTRLYTM